MYKRILVALSGTPFTPVAVRYAVDLATRHGASLTGVALRDTSRVHDVGGIPIGGSAAAMAMADARTQEIETRIDTEIHQFELRCKHAGLQPRIVRRSEETTHLLTDLWRYHDLTVIGLRGLFEYGVVRNPNDVVARLIARRVRPILAVAREHRPIRRVLVAYNGSMGSAGAFKSFVRAQLWPDVEIKIVVFNRADEAGTLLEGAAEYCAAHGYQVQTERVSCESPRHEVLVHAAACKADLVVMGSRSKIHVLDHILGSVTKQVLQNAEIPVFLTQ